jgi:hypothetical protein
MMNEAFVKMDEKESETYVKALSPSLEHGAFLGDHITVLSQDLAFYPGYRLLDIGDYGVMPPVRKFAVCKKDKNGLDVHMIDGTPAPIQALNAKGALVLDTLTVIPYVKFYYDYVRGAKGRFQIIQSIDDIQWLEEPPPAARQALGKMIAPMDLIDAAHLPLKADFILKASMIYRDSLFSCHIHVSEAGAVSISDEEMHIEDMPLLDDTIQQ